MSRCRCTLTGTLSPAGQQIVGSLSGIGSLVGSLSGSSSTTREYEGPYEATPTRETQTFTTQGFSMSQDFVVNPIPSNYGLITHDGSILTVS